MTDVADAAPVLVAIPRCAPAAALQPPGTSETFRMLQGETMGTTWSARFFAPPEHGDSRYRVAIEQSLQSIVDQMSHWNSDSDLSRFNRSSAGCWQTLPSAFFRVLEFSLRVAEQTGGTFDPTIGQLVEEWGFGPSPRDNRPPDPEVVSTLRKARSGWKRVELDSSTSRARHGGQPGLDFSAVAKGFAVDHVGHVLKRSGISSYLVEIGGELRASGLKPGGAPWWVALEAPTDTVQAINFPEIRIALSGWSIATSGDYRRFFEFGGRRWTHTIDPLTGSPIGGDIASVSVIHQDCMAADAYSTALMVLGAEQGIGFAERLELAALFVLRSTRGLAIRCTEQFYRMIDTPSDLM